MGVCVFAAAIARTPPNKRRILSCPLLRAELPKRYARLRQGSCPFRWGERRRPGSFGTAAATAAATSGESMSMLQRALDRRRWRHAPAHQLVRSARCQLASICDGGGKDARARAHRLLLRTRAWTSKNVRPAVLPWSAPTFAAARRRRVLARSCERKRQKKRRREQRAREERRRSIQEREGARQRGRPTGALFCWAQSGGAKH